MVQGLPTTFASRLQATAAYVHKEREGGHSTCRRVGPLCVPVSLCVSVMFFLYVSVSVLFKCVCVCLSVCNFCLSLSLSLCVCSALMKRMRELLQIWLQDLDQLRQQLPAPVMALYPAPVTRVGVGVGTDPGLEVLCMDGVNGMRLTTHATHADR